MSFEQSQKNTQQNLNRLISKCWEDASFKQELIANPVATMESFFGRSFGDKPVRYVVNDQTDPSVFNINIPPKPNMDDLELTDAELEAIAGGWYIHIANTTLCFGNGNP